MHESTLGSPPEYRTHTPNEIVTLKSENRERAAELCQLIYTQKREAYFPVHPTTISKEKDPLHTGALAVAADRLLALVASGQEEDAYRVLQFFRSRIERFAPKKIETVDDLLGRFARADAQEDPIQSEVSATRRGTRARIRVLPRWRLGLIRERVIADKLIEAVERELAEGVTEEESDAA